jgi:hypothetical protein
MNTFLICICRELHRIESTLMMKLLAYSTRSNLQLYFTNLNFRKNEAAVNRLQLMRQMLIFSDNSFTDALHYACQLTDWLNNLLYQQWIVHEEPVVWPLYPSDLTFQDFFLSL